MYFDAHTHLNHQDLYTNWEQHLEIFQNHGGVGLVNIGVDHEYNQK